MSKSTTKPSRPPAKQFDFALWSIILLAFVVRLVYVLVRAPDGIHGPDAELYDRIAWRLITEGRYIAEDHLHGMSLATRPALFPVVLGGIYAVFGRGVLAPRILQCLLGALTCGLTYSLGREAFNRRTGIFAGIGAAIFPQLIYYCGTTTTETLHIFLLTCAILLLFTGYRRDTRVAAWLAGGAALGLAVLARSAMLGLLPVLGLWLLIVVKSKRAAIARFLLVAVGAAAVMSPWVIRNYAALGRFVPATTEGGYTFWLTNNPRATGGGECYLPDDVAPFEGLDEVEADRLFYKMGFDFIRSNPGRTALLVAAKFGRLWRPWPHADHVGMTHAIIGGVSFVPVLLLAIIGAVMTWDRRRDLLLFYSLIGYTTILYCVYMAITRYRAPLMPVLLVLAGCAAARIVDRCRSRC